MPELTDEVVLNIDGFVRVDPAVGLRSRAQVFLTSRQWTTKQVLYGDQPEPEEEASQHPAWSMAFNLGLDHIKTTSADWCADVAALLDFVQSVQVELQNEFLVEVRYRSRLWYSEHITLVDGNTVDATTACEMIRRVVYQADGG